MYQFNKQSGFTLVEILVVLAISFILLFFTVSTFSDDARNRQFQTEINELERSITEQRMRSVAGHGDTVYGFNIGTTTLTLFTGPNYIPGDADNNIKLFSYSKATSSFSNGSTTIYFTKRNGEASATGTITLTENLGQSTSTLTIYASGSIE